MAWLGCGMGWLGRVLGATTSRCAAQDHEKIRTREAIENFLKKHGIKDDEPLRRADPDNSIQTHARTNKRTHGRARARARTHGHTTSTCAVWQIP